MPCTVKMTILIWLYLWSLQLLLCCSWHICSIIVINLPGVSTISPSITVLKLIGYPRERNLGVQCSPVKAGGLNFLYQFFSPWFFSFLPPLYWISVDKYKIYFFYDVLLSCQTILWIKTTRFWADTYILYTVCSVANIINCEFMSWPNQCPCLVIKRLIIAVLHELVGMQPTFR